MKRLAALLGILALILGCAGGLAEEGAAAVAPMVREAPAPDALEGYFDIRITGIDEQAITAKLYYEDRYEAEAVESLKTGDSVTFSGGTYTVSELVDHGDGVIEIIPEGEFHGYLILTKTPEGDSYYAVVGDDDGDWVPSTFAADVIISLPLGEEFTYTEYEAGEEKTRKADKFLARLREEDGIRWFTRYNTTAAFEGGVLVNIWHSDYPTGPAEADEAGETGEPAA